MALRITLFNRPNIVPIHLNTPPQSHQQSQQSETRGGQERRVSSGTGSTLTWEGIGELSGDNPMAIAALLKDIDRSQPFISKLHSILPTKYIDNSLLSFFIFIKSDFYILCHVVFFRQLKLLQRLLIKCLCHSKFLRLLTNKINYFLLNMKISFKKNLYLIFNK